VSTETTEHWLQRDGTTRTVRVPSSLDFTFSVRDGSELYDLVATELHFGEMVEVDDYKTQICDDFKIEILPAARPRGNLANVRMHDAKPYTMSFLKYFNGIDDASHRVSVSTAGCVFDALAARWKIKNKSMFLKLFNRASMIVHKKLFDPNDGVDAKMIEQVCWMKNASCLGFDQNSSVFIKYTQIIRRELTPEEKEQGKTAGKGNKSIVFYCAMAHMYLITDDKLIVSLHSHSRIASAQI
jgi:hypothetical protein